MINYIFGIVLVFLGLYLPPLGGYEQIFLILGMLIIVKKIKDTKHE